MISQESALLSGPLLSKPRTLQFWASTLVVLPVFVQAPWVHIHPFSALLFTLPLTIGAIVLVYFLKEKWSKVGALLLGVSWSWLGGCLFWGWLRTHPVWHLPVESIALPFALIALNTRWRIGAGFYLASLLGTAFTDVMIASTGVMKAWPLVLEAPLSKAPDLLSETAKDLINTRSILMLVLAAILIAVIAYFMKRRAAFASPFSSTWLVASAALSTTLWVDSLFFFTTLIQPKLSGLI